MTDLLNRTRRRIVRAVIAGLPAAILFRTSRAEASEKMTRQQAEYRDTPDGIYSCAMCTLFRHSGAARRAEPGIHAPDSWLWIPGPRYARPGMTSGVIVLYD